MNRRNLVQLGLLGSAGALVSWPTPQAQSRGEYMYELWNNPLHGKSPPEPAGAVTVVAARQVRR